MANHSLPRIIALCGKPRAGKSTAADLLKEIYGYEIVDDGLPLRQIAMSSLGLSETQVFTQAGKLQKVNLVGRTWSVREILGEIGNAFEEKFGGDIIPFMSARLMSPSKRYVLTSVRREQGNFWKEQGALVIEIDNPDVPESEFEFDQYSRAAIDRIILNDGLANGLAEDDALLDLCKKLQFAVEA